jgi:threonine dehydrogenase-like Zn-dependent dehydrogenase
VAEKYMRAARLHTIGEKFQVDEIPIPAVRPTDVLVKVETAGIVQNLRNVVSTYPSTRPHLPLPRLPAVYGLDAAGVVAAVGDRIRSGIKVGDRVYVNPGLSCGACIACRRGEFPNCASYTFMGYFGFGKNSQDQFDAYPYGGFSEYLTAPVANLVRLPDNVTFEQACRFGYLGTSYSGLRKLNFGNGQTLLVDGGTGTLGVGTVLLALAMGASKVFATGRDRKRLEKLKALDPSRVEIILPENGSVAEQVYAKTEGIGADAMLEALAPNSPAATVLDAFNALRKGGKAVNVGGVSELLPLAINRLMTQQKSLIGSLWFTTAEAEEMAAMAAAGILRLDTFENEVFSLENINDALDAIDSRVGGFTNIVIKHA